MNLDILLTNNIIVEEYKRYLQHLLQADKNLVFNNSGPVHAALVMESLFNGSHEIVRIYSGCLKGTISSNPIYKEALFDFCHRKGKVEILLQSQELDKNFTEDEEPPLFGSIRMINLMFNNPIQVRKKEVEINSEGKPIHFATGDRKIYRFETDTQTFKAACNFNDPVSVGKLDKVFVEQFSNAESIELV